MTTPKTDALRELIAKVLHDAIVDCCFGREGTIASWLRGPGEVEDHIRTKLEAALAQEGAQAGEFDARALAEKFARQVTEFPNQLLEWQEVQWIQPKLETIIVWFETELHAFAAGQAAAPRNPDLVIQRLPDWSYGAFLNETDASCIAIGQTEGEARNNGMRELLKKTAAPANQTEQAPLNVDDGRRDEMNRFLKFCNAEKCTMSDVVAYIIHRCAELDPESTAVALDLATDAVTPLRTAESDPLPGPEGK